jgi:hypothetical protein
MSSDTSATMATESPVFKNLLDISALKIQRERKKKASDSPSGFHSLVDTDINVIYGLCRRNVLINFNIFHFLSVIHVIDFSEKGP